MANSMASSGLRKMLYLPRLYLPETSSMDVQRETHGAKGVMASIFM